MAMFLLSDCPSDNHKRFVEGALAFYEESGMTPEPGGEWHRCHYPTPKHLGGTEIVWLTKEHHAIQGIFQGIELNRKCFWPWCREYLRDNWRFLYPDFCRLSVDNITPEIRESNAIHWKKKGSELGKLRWKHLKANPSEQKVMCQNGGRVAGKMPWWTNGETTTRSHECPGPGWRRGRK